jgi:hypothetical protein
MTWKKSVPAYTVAEGGGKFYIVHGGKEVRTPMGNPLRTAYRDLAQEVAGELERNGPDPTAGTSMYVCLFTARLRNQSGKGRPDRKLVGAVALRSSSRKVL